MAACNTMKLLQPFRMPLNAHLSDTRLSCVNCFTMLSTARNTLSTYNLHRRCKSTKVPEDRVLPPLRVKRFVYDKAINFLTNSVDQLEKRMPRTYRVYHTFRSGVSMFIKDTKQYYGITTRLWGGETLGHFTRRELELYKQFSSDLPVMGMVLIIAFAPGGVLVFPLAYMFPRLLLSPHFWTKQQKGDFKRIEMKQKVKHYSKILDHMHQNVERSWSSESRDQVKKAVNKVRKELDTSVILSQKEIVAMKPLFEKRPLSIDTIPFNYRRHLSNCLGFSWRRKKLVKEALLVRYIDVALRREGIHNLTDQDLDRACSCRGLNPEGVSRDAKLSYLHTWTAITADIHKPSISLLLHLPVLLAYSQPSNRKLMGSRVTSFRSKV